MARLINQILSWALGGILVVLLLIVCGLRVNVMPSVALGMYWLVSPSATPVRGMLVTVRTEDSIRLMRARHGWLASVMPILKPVAALPGDEVCQFQHELSIRSGLTNGLLTHYTPIGSVDPSLPSFPPEGVCVDILPGYVYVASTAPRSLDSRYIGPVPWQAVHAEARPLWTWEESSHATPVR